MKYWRGYVVAAVAALLSWGLLQFAAAHTSLMDMVYPYVTRVVQTSLAEWSSGIAICLWQVLFLAMIAGILTSLVLMIVLRWNPVQWFGWVLAALSIVGLLNTGLYGMNRYTGSVADDIRLETYEYSAAALEEAAGYYLDQANALAGKTQRDGQGLLKTDEFSVLAEHAGEGFQTLTYTNMYPVFAGSTVPVKELGWSGIYKMQGVTGKTVALTGEAAVNPKVPAAGLPHAICREMARRMSIYGDGDASFSAFLACSVHTDTDFQYSGYLMAFRECYNALAAADSSAGKGAAARLEAKMSSQVKKDLEAYNGYLGKKGDDPNQEAAYLLVNWHVQTVVIPAQKEEGDEKTENLFDPMDETDERLQDIVNPTKSDE